MTQQQYTPDGPLLPYPGHQPPKRSRTWLWLALGVAIAFGVSGLAWAWPTLTQPNTHTVVYQVEADAAHGSGRTGSYTIQTDTGGTSQGAGVLPMTGTYSGFHTGDFVYLSVQNTSTSGSVTCRIVVDGLTISENTSTGGYVIATCSGRVP